MDRNRLRRGRRLDHRGALDADDARQRDGGRRWRCARLGCSDRIRLLRLLWRRDGVLRGRLGGASKADYLRAHIPGAVYSDYLKDGWRIKDKNGTVGMLPPAEDLEKLIGGLGIATIFTLVLIPVIYSLLAPLAPARAHAGVRLDRELRDPEQSMGLAAAEPAE